MAQKPIPGGLNFVFGGLAGMAASAIVHPLDVVKNRMQLSGVGKTKTEHKTSFHVLAAIIKNEGVGAVYKGLTASLLRQATYSSTRLGIYNTIFEYAKGPEGQPPSFAMKALCGMFAGAVGAFVGTPAEVCLIRATADGLLPPAERRNYTNVFNAMYRITTEEGVLTLWRGCVPTIVRAIVTNGSQLGTYSQAKEKILESTDLKDGIFVHFLASMTAGLAATVVSMPVDIVKTRVQNMRTIDGKPEYTGAVDAMMKIFRTEGVIAFWKGFTPYYARIGPHTVFVFIFLEQMLKAYRLFSS